MIGPCAKRRTFATLVLSSGRQVSSENMCLNAQATCPRADGEGYDKCRSICQQIGHAEERAIKGALLRGFDLQGAVCFVHHHYACPACEALAAEHGVRLVFTAPMDSERTR